MAVHISSWHFYVLIMFISVLFVGCIARAWQTVKTPTAIKIELWILSLKHSLCIDAFVIWFKHCWELTPRSFYVFPKKSVNRAQEPKWRVYNRMSNTRVFYNHPSGCFVFLRWDDTSYLSPGTPRVNKRSQPVFGCYCGHAKRTLTRCELQVEVTTLSSRKWLWVENADACARACALCVFVGG